MNEARIALTKMKMMKTQAAQQPMPLAAGKSLIILGSTGSVGRTALGLVEKHPERFRVEALTAGENVALLLEQARRFRPSVAVIGNPAHFAALKEGLAGTGVEFAAGEEAVAQAAARPADLAVAAIVGLAGLRPTLAAIRQGTNIALANKEALVAAGELVLAECAKSGAALLPVDSEHSGVFRMLSAVPAQAGIQRAASAAHKTAAEISGNAVDFLRHRRDALGPRLREDGSDTIERITLTASGGPFLRFTKDQLKSVTPEQAVKHPTWKMGAKISVDSATLMNKGLEVIEAHFLFGLPPDMLDVVVHPESIVHSLVHYADGSALAHMSLPDMAIPLACALAWPERIPVDVPRLDLAKIGALHFEAPDTERFPCLALAREALEAGGSAPLVLNAANEAAVARFLAGEIGFTDIPTAVEIALARHLPRKMTGLEEILALDCDVRRIVSSS